MTPVERFAGVLARLPRPLDPIRSIKAKLSIVILSAVAMTIATTTVGFQLGLKPRFAVAGAFIVALVVVQLLAHGMVAPLREMAGAARSMARGDHGQAVRDTGRDEVGELARAFNAMSSELAAFERNRRELLAMVGHELRTPLTALQGNLENIADGVASADGAMVDAMLRQTHRLNRLVADLLDLSRLEAGEAPLRHSSTNLADVVEAVVEETQLSRPGAVVNIAVTADLVVEGDRDRLHQVLTNLVDNGLSHGGGGPVSVAARRRNGRVELEVLDDGPGIPDDVLPHVFDRFRRGPTDVLGGSGLGLAISRWIVELHGGSIRAENRHPRGARVLVELPAHTTT